MFDIRWEGAPTVFISETNRDGRKGPEHRPCILGSGGGIRTQGTLLTANSGYRDGNTAAAREADREDCPLVLNIATVSNNTAGFEPGTPAAAGIMGYIGGRLTHQQQPSSGKTSPYEAE